MNIEIKNCNNIDLANIVLAEDKLNIKFAPNGTGKSTIAKAISFGTTEGKDLNELMPFKYRAVNPDESIPIVVGIETIQTVMCFNEEYVSQFVFMKDELLNDSFDIFIKTEVYKEKEREIEELVAEIKQLFSENRELEILIENLKVMGSAFKLSKTGISKASTGMKGLAGGNKIQHIPPGLEAYQPFIQCQNSVEWVDWQTKGCGFTELSDSCPFCTSNAVDKKEQIQKVGHEYDKSTIKNLVAIVDIVERLGDYFSEDARANLATITTLQDGLEKEHEDFLVNIKTQIDTFIGKLEKLRTLSGFQFKDGEKVSELLPTYKLNLDFFSELDSDKTNGAIAPINASIDVVITKAGQLQGQINQQRIEIQRVVEQHQNNINGFLAYAGYSYKVEISGDGELAQLKLLHIDHSEPLSGGNQHLSFGERNAFAIVLFMYECLSKQPDLIILDDPISSFDKNKKYAILEMLFRRETDSCLKNKTVLMLTHDVEPIIDTIKSLSQQFGNQTSASFLKLVSGQISEYAISKDDIQTFSQICRNALNSNRDEIIKFIYMRRFNEIADNGSDVYQVLSNLLHKRERAIDSREERDDTGNFPEMDGSKFASGCTEIGNHIENFTYPDSLHRLFDIGTLRELYNVSTNGYEKLQVFRLLGLEVENSVVKKFINETYHVENEFICQLDPANFDMIPEYIISECDKIMLEAQ